MKPVKLLSEKLNEYTIRTDDLKISQWHFSFTDGQIISLGLKDGEISGPYNPPATKDSYGGRAYIRWADGKVSDAIVNAETLENLDSAMKEWKKMSYQDPNAPEVIEPLPIPKDLKIKDEKIVDMIKKDSSYFFEILNFYKNELGYAKIIHGQVGAGHEHHMILNSKGLNVEWESTGMQTYVSVNNVAEDVYMKRKAPEKKDLQKMIKEINNYIVNSKELVSIKSGKMPIILIPSVLGRFLGQFVISNLKGSIVANNQSIYSIEDFENKKQVFDEKISLTLDGLKDYATSTIPCSLEGVPSTKQYVIANGKLITPFLDLKYSKKTGMPPTSPGDLDLEVNGKKSYKRMIKGINYGLIVYDILGMHTQDSKSGKYSLAVDQGLLVENGEIKGKVKSASIDGNFFEALKNKTTKFAEYREDELAMLLESSIIV